MPSKSGPQHRLMEAAAHGAAWAVAKVKPAVANDFVQADKASGHLYQGGPVVKKKSALNAQNIPASTAPTNPNPTPPTQGQMP